MKSPKLLKTFSAKCSGSSGWKQNAEYARYCKKLKTSKPSFSHGYKFDIEQKEHVIYIFNVLQTHKLFKKLIGSNFFEMASVLFGCSENTVRKIIATNGEKKDERNYQFLFDTLIPNTYFEKFMNEIISRLNKGQTVTANYLKLILENDGINVNKKTIIRKLKSWNFQWGTLNERDRRKREEAAIKKRIKYLNQLLELEKLGFTHRIYLDESYVHQNHSLNKGWFFSDIQRAIYKKTGRGKRIAMVAAVGSEGWVPMKSEGLEEALKTKNSEGLFESGSILYWEVSSEKNNKLSNASQGSSQNLDSQKDSQKIKKSKKSENKRGNLDTSIFIKYFEENILNNLKQPTIIILDNASYHVSYEFHLTKKTTREEIAAYLDQRKIRYNHLLSKDELRQFALPYAREKTIVETIAEKCGHKVLYTPPYHPELSSIEYLWAQVKMLVAAHAAFDIKIICSKILPMAFASIKKIEVQKVFEHVRNVENMYRKLGDKELDLIHNKINQITETLVENTNQMLKDYNENHMRTPKKNKQEQTPEKQRNKEDLSPQETKSNIYTTKLRTKGKSMNYKEPDDMDIEPKKQKKPAQQKEEKTDESSHTKTNHTDKKNRYKVVNLFKSQNFSELKGNLYNERLDRILLEFKLDYNHQKLMNDLKKKDIDRKLYKNLLINPSPSTSTTQSSTNALSFPRGGFPRKNADWQTDNSCFIITSVVGLSSLSFFRKRTIFDILNIEGPWDYISISSVIPFPKYSHKIGDFQGALSAFFFLKNFVTKHAKRNSLAEELDGSSQTSAGDWILCLFDGLDLYYKEKLNLKEIVYDNSSHTSFLNYINKKNTMFIASESFLIRQTHISCKNCSRISMSYKDISPYMTVSVSNSNVGQSSFLRAFQNEEMLDKDYICPSCSLIKTSTKLMSTFILHDLPKFLVFEIQKERNESLCLNNKIDRVIKEKGSIELSLSCFSNNSIRKKAEYNVVSISKRYGRDLRSGHWKNYTKIGVNYFEFDDDKVYSITKTNWDLMLDNADILYFDLIE